jgi:small subunit ribosomal protein S4
VGEVVGVRDKSKTIDMILETSSSGRAKKFNWLEFNPETLEGRYVEVPNRDQIPENIKEQLIVELYSK